MSHSTVIAKPVRAVPRWSLTRVAYWTVAVSVLLYTPMAVSYMWFTFSPQAPELQNAVTAAVNGQDYATGYGSVHWARQVDYPQHRVAMLVHTTLGGVALALSMFQFSAKLRSRRPAVHRWIGRVYLVLMTISMTTAIIFLVLAPAVDYIGGTAFDLQLWSLAVGTLFSAGYAFWAIRNRDVITHRAWMGLNISLMMTAPLLRIVWIGLAPALPDADLLINLGAGSVMLGVVAPAAGAMTFMLTHRSSGRATRPKAAVAPRFYAVLLAIALVGTVGILLRFQQLPDQIPPTFALVHLVPVWAYIGLCAAGARRARAEHDLVREQRWSWLMAGAAATSIASLVTGFAAAVVYGPVEGIIAGVMVGAPGPIVLSFALVVHRAAFRPAPVVRPQEPVAA